MPLYEYRCEEHGPFNLYKSFDQEVPEQATCPVCLVACNRVFSVAPVHFHTDGFSKPRIDPFRTKAGNKPDYDAMNARAQENAEKERRAGLRED